ncbi:LWR-salt protein [Halostagnicola bangensis]
MNARYVFRVRLRFEPDRPDVSLEPATVETVLSLEAPEPGTDGWRFFRDTLWRGELSDQQYGRQLAEEWLEHPLEVEEVDFRELQTDEAYFEALKEEIAIDLEAFNAENVSEVLSKYLGSSIRVVGNGS